MKKNVLSVVAFLVFFLAANAQNELEVYPPHWWVGMKNPNVQLMLHKKDIAKNATVTSGNNDVSIVGITPAENPNYLFVDIGIKSSARPGKVKLTVKANGQSAIVNFELKERRKNKGKAFAQGINAADFVYLLMPDRFSNGDETNDKIAGLRDQTLNRDSIYHRHGGDLQGVINHLDYLQNMGVTALWTTPVIENDMPNRTEHGYAFTNHYNIEPRFGGHAAYKKLSDELHKRGMKLVQDAVYNHVGSKHITVLDPPFKDWLHQWPTYTNTTYKEQSLFDLYGAETDKKKMADGWFTKEMPDLNHNNFYVANYLIQHAIWCVEEFGVDTWRIDTYIYNDMEFMNKCNKALKDEYPAMTMFGETWVHGVLNQAYFVENNLNIPFKSNLTAVTDFQTNLHGINPAMTQKFGWTEGVNKLYTVLSNDFVYKNPMAQVIFLDNHDLSRWFTQVGEDINKHKAGIAWLLTCRGIPQMYYGTEVLMKGSTHPADGWVRLDFPGGWKNDTKNAFTGTGLTDKEKEIQEYTRKIANYRKNSSAIKSGKMMQFVPDEGLYVYFRYDANETVMCIMNTDEKERAIDFSKYSERTEGFVKGKDIASGKEYGTTFTVPAKQMIVLQLLK